jgi:hypothetical protein
MYEATPDLTTLWQGDVINDIYLPRLEFGSAGFLYKFDPKDGELHFGGQTVSKAASCKAVVLSQCCEFTEAKRDSFSVAELVSITDFTDQTALAFNLAELRPIKETRLRNADPATLLETNVFNEGDLATTKLVSCYVYDTDGHHFSEPHIADFTRITSISMKDKAFVAKAKILQLDQPHRFELKRKLAYFFSRPA